MAEFKLYMKEISLTQGKVALVDDEDFEALSCYEWFAWSDPSGLFYARRNVVLNGKRAVVTMAWYDPRI